MDEVVKSSITFRSSLTVSAAAKLDNLSPSIAHLSAMAEQAKAATALTSFMVLMC